MGLDRMDDYWMGLALKEARLALEEGEVPVGAVVVKEGMVIGKGHNRTLALSDPTAHAEMLAITAACESQGSPRLDECRLYTTLEPCAMCAGALVLGRLRKLYYAAEDPRMGACGSIFDIPRDGRMGHKVEIYRAGDGSASLKLLQYFYTAKRHGSNGSTNGR